MGWCHIRKDVLATQTQWNNMVKGSRTPVRATQPAVNLVTADVAYPTMRLENFQRIYFIALSVYRSALGGIILNPLGPCHKVIISMTY